MDVLIEIGPLPLAGVTDRDGDEPTPERSNFLLFIPVVPLDLFILLYPPEPPRSPPPPWVGASSDTCIHQQRALPCQHQHFFAGSSEQCNEIKTRLWIKNEQLQRNMTPREHVSCHLAVTPSVTHALLVHSGAPSLYSRLAAVRAKSRRGSENN